MLSKLTVGFSITIIGMLTVFMVLVVLWGVLELMRVVFGRKGKTPQKPSEAMVDLPVTQPVDVPEQPSMPAQSDDEEIIAVIMAAIACSLNTSTYNLNIKSLKRIDQSGPVWNRVGRTELINSRQI